MKYGISVPNFGQFFQPRVLADLACRAEEAGFDGFFVWDHMLFWRNLNQPVCDPWVALAAIPGRWLGRVSPSTTYRTAD
jgi:alkanesulfonate monooxygenase SsuD/methylene tetrahydromethanopterin reductase-like flavin-dependent oxidoreductase (luciferase family)